MPRMQRLDRSAVDNALGWVPPPSLPMCEPTQVHNRGTSNEAKERRVDARRQANATRSGGAVHWPFLYSYKEGGCVVNTAPHKSAYAQAAEVGEAWV